MQYLPGDRYPVTARRRRSRISIAALLAVSSVVGGCATPNVPTDVVTTGMPSAEVALRRSIDQVTADMTQIGGMRPFTGVSSNVVATQVVPDSLHKPIRFTWSGPLDLGVAKLAKSIGYSFVTDAQPNARPLPVAVNIDAQVITIFENFGNQAGLDATVEVDPVHQQVRVVHHV